MDNGGDGYWLFCCFALGLGSSLLRYVKYIMMRSISRTNDTYVVMLSPPTSAVSHTTTIAMCGMFAT
jgi:hypothetical protein